MHVLIVDDEADLRWLLRSWVEAEGATALEADSAEAALALIARQPAPAVALCDLRLPGEDGLWLAERLRAVSPETAVVMTTGVLEFQAAVTSLQAGVVDYLSKPFLHERFIEAFRRAFMAHQSRRALTQMHAELAQRRAEIADALAELELNVTTSLEAMLEMLRARDPGSYAHSHRVAKLAVDLAMTLQIGEPQLSDIERAALLHNLGRLALPDALLSRPEAELSPADRARLRTYPLHGHAMLKNVPFLTAANEIAVASHEHFDGTGFPHALRGDAIPLGARIIAVANAFDELVSGAAGRPVPPAQAIEVLSTGRAAQFDPLALGALRVLQLGRGATGTRA
jgi:response regulator RpfG family c-di-GMP phosphodiesterase